MDSCENGKVSPCLSPKIGKVSLLVCHQRLVRFLSLFKGW